MKGGALGAFGEHAIQRFRLMGSVGEADAADETFQRLVLSCFRNKINDNILEI